MSIHERAGGEEEFGKRNQARGMRLDASLTIDLTAECLTGLTVDLGDLPDFIRNSLFMDFKFERICIWVEILI